MRVLFTRKVDDGDGFIEFCFEYTCSLIKDMSSIALTSFLSGAFLKWMLH